MALAPLCLAGERRSGDPTAGRIIPGGTIEHRTGVAVCRRASGERIMPIYAPELVQTMRTVLDEVMTKIPVDQATPSVKAHLAEFILKAAAEGQTSYDALLTSASIQIQTILSMLS
jgi:hypothetical protein